MKFCRKCKTTKTFLSFHKNRCMKDRLSGWCKDCSNKGSLAARAKNLTWYKEREKEYRETHRDEARQRNKRYCSTQFGKWRMYINQIYKFYKITEEQYLKLLYKTKSRCFNTACNAYVENTQKGLAVDHCHVTGKVRGLLCTKCNIFTAYIESISKNSGLVKGLNEYLVGN